MVQVKTVIIKLYLLESIEVHYTNKKLKSFNMMIFNKNGWLRKIQDQSINGIEEYIKLV